MWIVLQMSCCTPKLACGKLLYNRDCDQPVTWTIIKQLSHLVVHYVTIKCSGRVNNGLSHWYCTHLLLVYYQATLTVDPALMLCITYAPPSIIWILHKDWSAEYRCIQNKHSDRYAVADGNVFRHVTDFKNRVIYHFLSFDAKVRNYEVANWSKSKSRCVGLGVKGQSPAHAYKHTLMWWNRICRGSKSFLDWPVAIMNKSICIQFLDLPHCALNVGLG